MTRDVVALRSICHESRTRATPARYGIVSAMTMSLAARTLAMSTIRRRQRQRYPWPPPVGERRNVGRAEPIADRLQPDRVVGGGESVVQRGESDPGPGRLLLGPLMSVQPDLDRIRQVGTDLDERRAELLVPQVEVETRDATVRPTPLEMRGTSTIRGPGTA